MYKIYRSAGLFSPAFFCPSGWRAAARAAVFSGLLAAPIWACAQALLPTSTLQIKGQAVEAEIAATPETRSYGLMNRQSLPENHGMLFVFEQPDIYCFWMKNTLLPLSIAFVDAQGRIVTLADMQPQSLDTHCPAEPVQYALEMRQGWFTARGIQPGEQIKGLPRAGQPRAGQPGAVK